MDGQVFGEYQGTVNMQLPTIFSISCSASVLLVILMVLTGCEDLDKKTTATSSQPVNTTTTAKPTTPATIPPEKIELFDGVMRRSNDRVVTGDLMRPLWIVSGRIRNYSGEDLAHLQLQIHIFQRRNEGNGTLRDEASLDFETDIPAGTVGAFSRQVQLLPPQNAWDWDWVVIEARAKTR
jgi:hypothetical protein